MKKSKFLKPFSFASLALLMGAAGVFAFAPLGASPSVANASEMVETTTEQGLITPKADDPVIYTTESGINIKWGLSAPGISHSGISGNLSAFPYFNTSKSGITYTWVVIGRATDVQIFSVGRYITTFSNWKSRIYPETPYMSGAEPFAKYFFDNIYEDSTPAGKIIDTELDAKAQLIDSNPNNVPKTNSEIPSGCVLCLSNDIIEQTYFGSGGSTASSDLPQAMRLDATGTSNGVRQVMLRYANEDTFGFNDYLSSIQDTTITQRANTGSWVNYSATLKFFPLANYSSSYENFMWQTYLTANQVKSTGNFWGRSTYNNYNVYATNTSGSVTNIAGRWSGEKSGSRPAFVLSIL